MKMTNLKALHRILFGAFFLCSTLQGKAQVTETPAPIPASFFKEKMFDHFVGVQANLLIQQIFNFGEPNDVNNPYLIKYTLRHNETGLAFNAGFGINASTSENDEGFKRTNDGYDSRFGIGYQKTIGSKIEVGVGADFLYGYQAEETFSIQVITSFGTTDSTITTSTNKVTSVGGGLQASFSYVFAKRFLVGTEMSFYYTKVTDKFNVTSEAHFIQNGLDPSISINATNESADGTELKFQVPIAIFIAFKF